MTPHLVLEFDVHVLHGLRGQAVERGRSRDVLVAGRRARHLRLREALVGAARPDDVEMGREMLGQSVRPPRDRGVGDREHGRARRAGRDDPVARHVGERIRRGHRAAGGKLVRRRLVLDVERGDVEPDRRQIAVVQRRERSRCRRGFAAATPGERRCGQECDHAQGPGAEPSGMGHGTPASCWVRERAKGAARAPGGQSERVGPGVAVLRMLSRGKRKSKLQNSQVITMSPSTFMWSRSSSGNVSRIEASRAREQRHP